MGRSQESWCWKHFEVNEEKNSATYKVHGLSLLPVKREALSPDVLGVESETVDAV